MRERKVERKGKTVLRRSAKNKFWRFNSEKNEKNSDNFNGNARLNE